MIISCKCYGFCSADINECLHNTTNDCDGLTSTCNDTDGSYECVCLDGFTAVDSRTCQGK